MKFVWLILLLAACQTKPTVVHESSPRQFDAPERLLGPIKLTPETVIVDARPRFEYSMAHIPRSISLQWMDFTEPEPAQRGVVQHDTFAVARRLARLGIGPATSVVVVGPGKSGQGEEGRLAWTFAYLGLTQVRFTALESLKPRLTNIEESEFAPAVPIWKPELIDSLNVTKDEVKFAIKDGALAKARSFEGASPAVYRIIDVRSEKDYLGHEGFGAERGAPNLEAINIPWSHFFADDLRPRPIVREELERLGIRPDQRVIVLDQNGVASAAVTMALRAMGYTRAGNYAGGLIDLLAR